MQLFFSLQINVFFCHKIFRSTEFLARNFKSNVLLNPNKHCCINYLSQQMGIIVKKATNIKFFFNL